MSRADFIVLNNKETRSQTSSASCSISSKAASSAGTKSAKLGQVLTGDHPGRQNDGQEHYLLQEQYRRRAFSSPHGRLDLRRVVKNGGSAESYLASGSARIAGEWMDKKVSCPHRSNQGSNRLLVLRRKKWKCLPVSKINVVTNRFGQVEGDGREKQKEDEFC